MSWGSLRRGLDILVLLEQRHLQRVGAEAVDYGFPSGDVSARAMCVFVCVPHKVSAC